MTRVKRLCANVSADIKPQAEALAKAVEAMQEKIEQQIPVYAEEPLAQEVRVNTGEIVIRANPTVQEFRATVRDYAAALKNLQDILENNKAPAEVTQLDEIRARFKVAK